PSGAARSLGCVGGSGADLGGVAEVRRLVEQLSELHAQLGESIPRDEDSPFLATWLISGRILQLADGFVFMVEAGYGAETIALDRAMLELSILVLGLNRDPAMVQMWLDDKWVPPRRAREALKRPAPFWSDDLRARRAEVERRAARGEIAEAEAADLISTLDELVEVERRFRPDADEAFVEVAGHLGDLYDALSAEAHSRRSAIAQSLAKSGGSFLFGPQPSSSAPSTDREHLHLGRRLCRDGPAYRPHGKCADGPS